jgi:hypothetical protein
MTDNLPERMEYSKALAASDLLPKQYRNNPANVLVAVEYGRALGLEPMAAIQGIHVVEGKPTASAQLIGALVRNAGHRLRVVGDDTQATATIRRADDPDFEFTATWSIQRAAKANLTGKGVWKSYPAAMLKARAITEVARDACPEVLAGVAYTAEEIGADDTPAPTPPPVPPVAPTVTVTREPEPAVDYDTGEIIDEAEDFMLTESADEPVEAEIVDEPADLGPPATKAQMAKLGAQCNALGLDRDARLTIAADIVGRKITSAAELSKAEASRVIEELQRDVDRLPEVDE